MALTFNPFTGTFDFKGSGSGNSYSTNTYSSILAPQLFNPDASGVSGGTDDFTLSSANAVALVTLNGQVLDDSEYSLASSTLTVTPDVGFTDTNDEVLVFQHSFSYSSTQGTTYNLVQKSANYTALVTDYYIEATANTFTVTLPTAVDIAGQTFIIKNSGSGIVTVDGDGSETIDGQTDWQLQQYDALTVTSNGSNWLIV